MKKWRGPAIWLLLFAGGLWLGRQYSAHRASSRAVQAQDIRPEKRRGTARVAPLSEAEALLRGGGSPESLERLDAEPIPSPDLPADLPAEPSEAEGD